MISIAVMLAGVTSQLINMLSSRVFFSSLSTIFRTSPATFKQHFIRTKNHLLLFTQPIFLCLIYFGESIVELLYDERYLIAGEYLVMLAWVGACSSIRLCNGAALLAQGKSQIHMLIRIINAIARPAAMFYGFEVH
jgi:O-antigen/teichoic acid export membrane protein